MNIKDYKDKKTAGLTEIVKAGGGYAFATKRYSQDDGSELTPEIESLDLDKVTEKKEELIAEAADYDLVIADVAALNVAEPK